tara:strand:- start:1986 stop:2135 length:150 start_codon:yes stop_codon:yes gene_type:complete
MPTLALIDTDRKFRRSNICMEAVNGGIAPVVVVRVVIALIAVFASSKAN